MNSDEIRNICQERLGSWTNRLVEGHATPVLLMAVGHDHKSGELVLLTLEDLDDRELLIWLRGAEAKLEAKVLRGK